MAEPSIIEPIIEPTGLVAAAIAALVGLVVALRKLYLMWRSDDVRLAESGARETLIQQLHGELDRMDERLRRVIDDAERAKLVVDKLRLDVARLEAENAGLRKQIAILKGEA